MSNKKFNFIYLILAIQLVLSSCVPKDEFLPEDTMKLGATGLREKTLEEQQIEKEKRAAEREKINNINDRIFEDVSSTAVDVSESPIVISSVDQIFSQSSRKVMYVNGSEEVEATTNPATFQKMKYIVGGQFLVGDQVIFYPDRDCEVSPLRKVWTTPMEKEVDSMLYIEAISAAENEGPFLPGNIEIELAFDVFPNEIADGEFHPTIRYVRNGNISSCYSFIERSQNLFKDTILPQKPGVIKVVNPVTSDQFALVEVYGNIEPGYTVELFQGESCSGSSLTNKISTSGLARFTYLFKESDLSDLSLPGQSKEFVFSSRYRDKAGNIGECSNDIKLVYQFPTSLEKVTIKEVANNVIKSSQDGFYIGDVGENVGDITLQAITYFNGDEIIFYNGESCLGTEIGRSENTTGSDGEHVLEMDTSCGGITDCVYSAKKIANDGKVSCSPKVTYVKDTSGPVVKFPNSNEVGQIFGSLSTGGMHREGFSDSGTVSTKETGVLLSSIEKGLTLNIDDHFVAHGEISNIKVKIFNGLECLTGERTLENDLSSTFELLRLTSSSLINDSSNPTGTTLLENKSIRVEDSLGNLGDCIGLRKLVLEPAKPGVSALLLDNNGSIVVSNFGMVKDDMVNIESHSNKLEFQYMDHLGFFLQLFSSVNDSQTFLLRMDKSIHSPWYFQVFGKPGCEEELSSEKFLFSTESDSKGFTSLGFGAGQIIRNYDPSIHDVTFPVEADGIWTKTNFTAYLKDERPLGLSALVTNTFGSEMCISIQSPEMPIDAGDGIEPFGIDTSFNFSLSDTGCTLSGALNGFFDGIDDNEMDEGEDLIITHDSGCEKVLLKMEDIKLLEKNTTNVIEPLLSYNFVTYPLDGGKGLNCGEYSDSNSAISAHSSSYVLGNKEFGFVDSWITSSIFGDDYTSYVNKTSIEMPTGEGNFVLCPRSSAIPLKTQGNGFLIKFIED